LEKRDKPRGILYPVEAPWARLSRYHPAADIAVFVEHVWIVIWDLRGREPRIQETLPHPSVHLVVEQGRSGIIGVVRGRFTRVLEHQGRVFGVKFKPGGFHPFFQAPVSRLTNRTVTLRSVFGSAGAAYAAAVLAESDETRLVAIAEAFLRRLAPTRDPTAEALAQIVADIAADRTITTVAGLVRRCDCTTRSLQRLFAQYIGVSPKWVIKRYRLHEVVERPTSGDAIDWTQLALELGYFDQAHFIRDFKSIVGRTPGDYVKQVATA
jgi:AraC-like DNA-binding protein